MHSPLYTAAQMNMPHPAHPAASREPKLLIVYASYGDGHLQAARAIRDALELHGVPQQRIKLVDLMAESNPLLNEVSRRFYLRSYSMLPALYGWVYDRTRPMKHDSLFGGWLHSFGRERLGKLLEAERPDAIVYTFPIFAIPFSRSGKPRLHRVPTAAVVTDFDLHCRWVHPHVDRYFVATEDLKAELVRHGISRQCITASGIPIKPGFAGLRPDPHWHAKYGIPADRPLVLIIAGAHGVMPDVAAICDELLANNPSVTIALVCGRNAALEEEMRQRYAGRTSGLLNRSSDSGPDGNIRIFGYVEQLHELMALADCLVTKPGGITLSEGLAASLPLFIYRPVPGQEKNNAIYLANKGAAFIANRPDELCAAVGQALRDPAKLASIRTRSSALGRSGAAETIALEILAQWPIMEEASSTLHTEGASLRGR